MMMINGSATTGGGGGGTGKAAIEDELSLPILLAERVRKAALEADSMRSECGDIGRQVDLLADMLRTVARRAASTPSLYDRPIRSVFYSASTALERALSFARRCRRNGVLRRVVSITIGSADHRKAQALLEASIGDLRWLLSLYASSDGDATAGGIVLSLPPIASTDPIISWVWSYIATVQMAASPADRAEAAASLANLALDNDRNKKMIIEEGGIPPLLTLLRDGPSVDARISAATALGNLAASHANVAVMLKELAVPVIVAVLFEAPMRLQTHTASIVSRMAAHSPVAQEEFARENAIRPLVSLLSFEVHFEDPKLTAAAATAKKSSSMHSLVKGFSSPTRSGSYGSNSRGGSSYWERSHYRKAKEDETPEAKLQLKIACADALWMLSRGCVSNSRKITETKGLLCLAKIIEAEKGELQYKCLLTVAEIASAAESDADLRCSAFKTNSPAAKPLVDQLLRLLQPGSSSVLLIPAIKAIGSLSRTFAARESHVLRPLVIQLEHLNPDVAVEAAKALGKFTGPDNFLCVEHSKAIIGFEGVRSLNKLLRWGEKTQLPAFTLLCHLALHVPDSEAMEQSKVLGTFESAARTALAQHPSLKELLPNAIYHLELYRGGGNSHDLLYAH